MYPTPPDVEIKLIKDLSKLSDIRACGFILYTDAHADMKKVLRDQDYWDEFNVLSGPLWPIFAVRPIANKPVVSQNDKSYSDVSMTIVPTSYSPSYNNQFIEFFDICATDLPCFVLFTWDDRDNLVRDIYRLPNKSVGLIHSELNILITTISGELGYILPEYRRNMEAYTRALSALKSLGARKRYSKVASWVSSIKSLYL